MFLNDRRIPIRSPDSAVFAERDERAEILINVGLERLSLKAGANSTQHMRSLLVGCLGSRGHRHLAPRPGAGGAITDRENVGVGGRLQGRQHHELIDAVNLEAKAGEQPRRLHPGRPDDELGLE